MMFDTLSGIAERHLPEFIPMLARARLFRMEAKSQSRTVGEVIEDWHPDQRLIENFRLPFKTIAIEEADSRQHGSDRCVVFSLADEGARSFQFLTAWGSKGDAITIGAGALIALPGVESLEASNFDRLAKLVSLRNWEGTKKTGLREFRINLSLVNANSERIEVLEQGNAVQRALAKYAKGDESYKEDLNRLGPGGIERYKDEIQANGSLLACLHGILSVLVINEPTRFIVEERLLHEPRQTQDKVVRSLERAHYIVLKPREIRNRLIYTGGHEESDDEERRKTGPHERRGHFRTLRSERFKQAKGQVIWINPMWIGPSECIHSSRRYKVRIDL